MIVRWKGRALFFGALALEAAVFTALAMYASMIVLVFALIACASVIAAAIGFAAWWVVTWSERPWPGRVRRTPPRAWKVRR